MTTLSGRSWRPHWSSGLKKNLLFTGARRKKVGHVDYADLRAQVASNLGRSVQMLVLNDHTDFHDSDPFAGTREVQSSNDQDQWNRLVGPRGPLSLGQRSDREDRRIIHKSSRGCRTRGEASTVRSGSFRAPCIAGDRTFRVFSQRAPHVEDVW